MMTSELWNQVRLGFLMSFIEIPQLLVGKPDASLTLHNEAAAKVTVSDQDAHFDVVHVCCSTSIKRCKSNIGAETKE